MLFDITQMLRPTTDTLFSRSKRTKTTCVYFFDLLEYEESHFEFGVRSLYPLMISVIVNCLHRKTVHKCYLLYITVISV